MLMRRLQSDQEEQLSRQRAPKRKGDEPAEDWLREPLRQFRRTTLPHRYFPERLRHRHPPAAAKEEVNRSGELKTHMMTRDLMGRAKPRSSWTEWTRVTRGNARRVNAALHRAINYIGISGNIGIRGWAAHRAPEPALRSVNATFRRSRSSTWRRIKPMGCDVPVGSVMELSPGVDRAGSRPLQHRHASGQIAGEPETH